MSLLAGEAAGSRIALMRAHWGHMARESGFDGLAGAMIRVIGPERIVSLTAAPGQSRSFADRLARRVMRQVAAAAGRHSPSPAACPIVQPAAEHAGSSLVAGLRADPRLVGVLLAGEEQFGRAIATAETDVRRRLTVVLHQPPSWLRLHWRDFCHLDGLRAIVAVSQEQARFLGTVTSSPVVCIKHGVNLEHFQPAPGLGRSRGRLLFVGKWLRDFRTLRRTMENVWNDCPEIELDCVVPRDAREGVDILSLARDRRVHWHADISAEQLRDLYWSADLLFLPVIDATANNAVVEALACGLPVISTNVGGMPDYVSEATGELCEPGNASAHADAVLRWLSDSHRRKAASHAARAFAEQHLDWTEIARGLLAHPGLSAVIP